MHTPWEDAVASVATALLGACATLLSLSAIAVIGWLAVAGFGSYLRVMDPRIEGDLVQPLIATLYVTMIALPLTAFVGIMAAIGAADVRIFGAAAPGMRRAIGLLGSVPTVVVALALLLVATAAGWRPSLTGAALAVAIANMPLMTALALSVFAGTSMRAAEAATALGASSGFIVRAVLLPRAGLRLAAAVIIAATQIIGGAAVVAIVGGARVPLAQETAVVGAWPLAVHLWLHSTDAATYGMTAAAAVVLSLCLWLLQGVALLRSAPAEGGSGDYR